jgi:polyribonucleotide nucleotidyltransferase
VYDGDDDTKEVLLIDPKFVGRIVGKGGETIKSIQDDYSVKVNIDKEEDDVSDIKLKETSSKLIKNSFSGWHEESRNLRFRRKRQESSGIH